MADRNFIITTFYKFITLNDVNGIKLALIRYCLKNNIKGTILLAEEGINATVMGLRHSIDGFYEIMQSIIEFNNIDYKESISLNAPFKKLKIKIKPEIVTFKEPSLNMQKVGERLNAQEWNDLIKKNETIVIDCRNDYEVAFGTFKKAQDPKTRNFTDLKEWIQRNVSRNDKAVPIAMFCTGGVRCEKSTAYMLKLGFENVYHLNGGILKYIEDTKTGESLWEGQCFVFDDRISVNNQMKPLKQ